MAYGQIPGLVTIERPDLENTTIVLEHMSQANALLGVYPVGPKGCIRVNWNRIQDWSSGRLVFSHEIDCLTGFRMRMALGVETHRYTSIRMWDTAVFSRVELAFDKAGWKGWMWGGVTAAQPTNPAQYRSLTHAGLMMKYTEGPWKGTFAWRARNGASGVQGSCGRQFPNGIEVGLGWQNAPALWLVQLAWFQVTHAIRVEWGSLPWVGGVFRGTIWKRDAK